MKNNHMFRQLPTDHSLSVSDQLPQQIDTEWRSHPSTLQKATGGMVGLEDLLRPVERHYATLLAALCRSARVKTAEQRGAIMRGIVRSIVGNNEPERTVIANLVLLELSTSDDVDLSADLSKRIASGNMTGARQATPTGARVTHTRERRRHRPGDARSTPWLPTRERRLLG